VPFPHLREARYQDPATQWEKSETLATQKTLLESVDDHDWRVTDLLELSKKFQQVEGKIDRAAYKHMRKQEELEKLAGKLQMRLKAARAKRELVDYPFQDALEDEKRRLREHDKRKELYIKLKRKRCWLNYLMRNGSLPEQE
jgi:hypothetical protein